MRSSEPLVWLAAVVALLGTGITWGAWVTTEAPGALALAVSAQLAGALAMAWVIDQDRRALTAALAFAVPVVGPLAVAWSCGTRGHGGTELLADPSADPSVPDGLELARRLTTGLPPCEALVSGDLDARRATIARLTARGGADDLAILRWARTQPDPELVVEVALALEDLGQQFDRRLQVALDAATSDPSFATHAAVLRAISDGVVAGLVEPQLVARLTAEARAHHKAALALEPRSATELVAPRARLELAVARPEDAIGVLGSAICKHADPELIELYAEAAYAARRFDLVIDRPARAARDAHGWS